MTGSRTLRPLIFVTGKGGVGKTTVAFACAKALSSTGKRTLLIEWGRNNQSSAVWNRRIKPYVRVQVEENLYVFRLVPDYAMEEYVKVRLRTPLLYWPLLRSKVWKGFSKTIPALKESVVIGKLWFMISEQKEFEDIEYFVFDGPSTGNAIAMIDVPYKMKEAFIVGPMRGEAQKLIDLLESHNTVYWVVTYGEELAVEECVEFVEFIKPREFRVIFNRNYELDLDEKHVEEFPEELKEKAKNVYDYYFFRRALISEYRKRLENLKPVIVPNVFEEFEKTKVIEAVAEKFLEVRPWEG